MASSDVNQCEIYCCSATFSIVQALLILTCDIFLSCASPGDPIHRRRSQTRLAIMDMTSETRVAWDRYHRNRRAQGFMAEYYYYDYIRNIIWCAILQDPLRVLSKRITARSSVPAPEVEIVTQARLERHMAEALRAGAFVPTHTPTSSQGSIGSSQLTFASASTGQSSRPGDFAIFTGQPDLAIYELKVRKDFSSAEYVHNQQIYMIIEVKRLDVPIPWGLGRSTNASAVRQCAQLTHYAILMMQQNVQPVALVARWAEDRVFVLCFYSRGASAQPEGWNDVVIWFIKSYVLNDEVSLQHLTTLLQDVGKETISIARVQTLFALTAGPVEDAHNIFSGNFLLL